MLWIILGITVSYILGSIPTAYIFVRLLKGVDIRNFGSGNVGATNAFRLLGKGAGITVLILDMLKGFLAAAILGDFVVLKTNILSEEAIRMIFSLVCVCGHNWTIFLRFRGGKGIATSFGILIGLSSRIHGFGFVLGLVVLVWLLVFSISRIVSISSVLAGISLPVFIVIFKHSNLLVILSFILSILVVLRHKANLIRLFQGKEPRLIFKKPS